MSLYKNSILAAVGLLLSMHLTGCGHIEANVPEQSTFKPFLVRDLNSYFTTALKKPIRVEYDLLRKGPTQTGIAYPKFYAWVRVFDGNKLVEEGAVRVAACDKEVFQVTDFVSKEQVQKDPEMIRTIFPSMLCSAIVARANKT